QRSQAELAEVTVLPIRASVPAGDAADGEAAAVRRTLLDLLPPDALLIEEAGGPDADEVARAWKEAAHHLEIARRLGDEVPAREEILEEPGRWGQRLAS